MKILFLAPQPFFQERGTPIAVKLACETLAKERGDEVTLITYREGEDIPLTGITHLRMEAPIWLNGVGPGISLKKIICDVFFCFFVLKHLLKRSSEYNLIHAVEESVFIALLAKWTFKIPYIYDMDSSLAQQLTQKWWILYPLKPLLSFFETIAIRNASSVIAVCDALEEVAREKGAKNLHLLYDISLLDLYQDTSATELLRGTLGIHPDDCLILYVGNFEPYQGLDLLLESFAKISTLEKPVHLVLIGGNANWISTYKEKIARFSFAARVHFPGPRPVTQLKHYLKQADILVSPRIKGNNTPMKIYSYLHSGVPVVATKLPTHTQVINESLAVLAPAEPEAFAAALQELATSASKRELLGQGAKEYAEKHFSYEAFVKHLKGAYASL